LKADDGWLALTGLHWLKEGVNRFGADQASDIVLPGLGSQAGTIQVRDKRVIVQLSGEKIPRELKPDIPGPPDVLALGDLQMRVLLRNQRYALRVHEKTSPARRQFQGLRWYPVKEAYRLTARFVSYPKPRPISIATVLGYSEEMQSPGYAVFRVRGYEWHLQPVLSGDQLFFIFRDGTSGRATYGAGRYLYADLPKDGQVILDFNKAISPPCAFTSYATCPLPPMQNHLRVRIEAGEMNPQPAKKR
jgi:uncharacterized protein (DUF1684 family)